LLPTGLEAALDALESEGDVFRKAFGGPFVDFVLSVKRHELGRFQSHVTDWEQREYFEVY
jgi:glutamine synthetase